MFCVSVCVGEMARWPKLCGRQKWTKLMVLSSENLGEMFSFHSRTFSTCDRPVITVSGDREGEVKKTGTFYIKRGQKQSCSTLPLSNHTISFFALFSDSKFCTCIILCIQLVYIKYTVCIYLLFILSYFFKGAFWSSLYFCIRQL